MNRGVWGDWAGAGERLVGFPRFVAMFWATCWSKIGIVGVLVRRLFICSFSGGPESRSARAGAVETQFFMFEPASNKAQSFSEFEGNFGHEWLPNLIKQKHVKIGP